MTIIMGVLGTKSSEDWHLDCYCVGRLVGNFYGPAIGMEGSRFYGTYCGGKVSGVSGTVVSGIYNFTIKVKERFLFFYLNFILRIIRVYIILLSVLKYK